MGCGNCGSSATAEGGKPTGCQSNGNCNTGGCNKLNVYDWLKDMTLPSDHIPFNIVEIRFKGSRKEFYRNEDNLDLYTGDAVVVESDLGHDVGHVSLSGELVRLQMKKRGVNEDEHQIRKIYRKASDNDISKYDEFKEKEPATLESARTIAMSLRLQMKISDIEFQGDGRKVIFFYTAEGRVDFRELIRRYAAEFKTRIEMRQVSYREEASRLGGIGSCGRELCCSTWLTDYKVVSIGAAKNQNLSINMLKLSGQCGRLKCCLNYELETYQEALKEFPRQDKLMLETQKGRAFLVKTDILKRLLWFTYPKSSDWTAISLERVNEILEMNKKGVKPESLLDLQFAIQTIESIEPPADLISDQSLTRMDDKNPTRNKDRRGNKNPGSSGPQGKSKSSNNNRDRNRNPNNKSRSRNKPLSTDGQAVKGNPTVKPKNDNPSATARPKNKKNFRKPRPKNDGPKPE
jgi:cell fate regulator YaaT (PSP1 superfamily)